MGSIIIQKIIFFIFRKTQVNNSWDRGNILNSPNAIMWTMAKSQQTAVGTSIGPCQYALTEHQLCPQCLSIQELKLGASSEPRIQDAHTHAESQSPLALAHRACIHLVYHLAVYSGWSWQFIQPDKYSEYHSWLYVATIYWRARHIIFNKSKTNHKTYHFHCGYILLMFNLTPWEFSFEWIFQGPNISLHGIVFIPRI